MDKIYEKWCEKLLDTGKGNRLINFKDSQLRTLDILLPTSTDVFKRLSGGEKLAFYDVDEYVAIKKEEFKMRNAGLPEEDKIPEEEFKISKNQLITDLSDKLSKRQILSYKSGTDLEKVLKTLKKKASESIVEKGINILYVTFGMLHWLEKNEKDLWLNSPLVLIPIVIEESTHNDTFYISEYEDEYTTNPALLYKLRSEYNLELPEFRAEGFEEENLLDYLERVKAYFSENNWTVRDEVKIGTFSFLKLDMYKDLKENKTEVLKNDLVVRILDKNYAEKKERELSGESGKAVAEGNANGSNLAENSAETIQDKVYEEVFGDTESVDAETDNNNDKQEITNSDLENSKEEAKEKIENKDFSNDNSKKLKNLELKLHNVVDADFSQMSAIYDAKMGNSFVLQGPPGTGKSQTITNLIAEFLYDNKKVLFVSEKLAALKVVYNNMKKVGLSDFCLEIHSNKASKKEVIAELYRVLTLGKKNLSKNAEIETEMLKKYKSELDMYAEVLHKVLPNVNKSPYEILSLISQYKDISSFEYVFENLNEVDTDYILECMAAIELFENYSEFIGFDYRENCWYGYNNQEINYQTKMALKKNLDELSEYFAQLNKLVANVEKIANIEINNFENFDKNLEVLRFFPSLSFYDSKIFNKENLIKINAVIKVCMSYESQLKDLEKSVYNVYSDKILELDARKFSNKFNGDYNTLFRFFNKDYKKDLQTLKSYQVDKSRNVKFSQIKDLMIKLEQMKELKSKISENRTSLKALFSSSEFAQESTDLSKISNELIKLEKVIYDDFDGFEDIEKTELENVNKSIKELLSFYDGSVQNRDSLREMQNSFDLDVVNFEKMQFFDAKAKLSGFLENFDEFENWIRFVVVLEKFEKLNLKNFIEKSIDFSINRETLHLTFEKMIYNQLVYSVIEKDAVLLNFTRMTQDSNVINFRKKDKLRFEISKAEIIAKLMRNMPDSNSIASESQVSTLVREANKKSKQKPVRVLFREIDQLVKRLKPCMLMSPLSVSSYLDVINSKFDVVIFDEASQIFPWDSIGAIARGKQVIVVGDSKQMPPSNFFNIGVNETVEDENEFEDDSLDFESILDLSSAVFNQNRLNWHYRSKTEELIAFSNANFYDGTLVTFPSAFKNREDMGVDFYYVEDGIFNRKTKTNKKEAEKVVDLVFEHFKTHPERSLGVVAFSISQQSMIEQIITERRAKDDKFADFFDSSLQEPFFVKNLETVQGDERDTIIFSVAYAKDENGKFLHNFGPLNKKGGERRLNVAVTRAKQSVKLVASIKSHDIDLGKSSATGTRLLKEYIDYAQRGADNYVHGVVSDDANLANIENEVFDFLTQNGFKAVKNIGCSEYKIDIGIQNPLNADFVLAIECDGRNYKNSKTTRDRDRLRQEVLERLGWKFYRVWSIDWFLNKAVEKKKLLAFVEKAMNDYYKEMDSKQKNSEEQEKANGEGEDNTNFLIENPNVNTDLKSLFAEYEEYDIYSKKFPTFENSIYDLVKTEAPITEEYLLKKTAPLFGREKITNVVRQYFADNMKKFEDCIFKVEDFYVVDKNMNIQMRVPKEGAEPRDILNISNVELASGLLEVIKKSVGITKKGLFNTTASLLGYSRMGNNIQQKLTESLEMLLESNFIKIENDQYFIN